MIDKAIVSAISMVFLLILFLSMMGMMLTFVKKIDFDQACRNTLLEIDLAGGLSEAKRQELNDSLEQSGYLDISIEAPGEVQYGEWISLRVNAALPTTLWSNLFQDEEGMLYFSYGQKIVSRKIHNMAY